MKLSVATTLLVTIAPALAAPFPVPPGFYEQCCVRRTPNGGRQLAQGALAHLNGYNRATGEIDELCDEEATREGVSKPGGWTCYNYDEVCTNDSGYFGGTSPSTSDKICNNRANCYNDGIDGATAECTHDQDYPDIWWGCSGVAGLFPGYESFHCGFQCKFTDACGDPHFQTFDKKWYDFHGECDLVLLKAEEFGMGLGLDIHVRTKGRYEYSFIESAAVKIGDDILEVSSYGAYAFNGVSAADLSTSKFADMYTIEYTVKDAETSEYVIQTGGNEYIKLKSFKDLVSVKTTNATAYNFGSSQGMMGDFFQGEMLARDGTTIITDADQFGLEWQVTESDPSLFQTPSPVEGKCIMPLERVSAGRRLGAVDKEAAEKACSHVEGSKFDNCVFDVVATGDLDSAKSY